MTTSLVADYGTSSGSESDQDISKGREEAEEETTEENEEDDDDDHDKYGNEDQDEGDGSGRVEQRIRSTNGKSDESKLPLPTPNFAALPTLKTSVFTNPFVEAERAKSAILEKHVKMTPTLDDTKMINGRKICWNYRKGRCRFGHNCTFAHDSDVHRSVAELEASKNPEETLICQTRYTSQVTVSNDEEQEIDQENNELKQKRKKRPGLAQNLVPGKKVLKLYKAQQAKTLGR
ncbi:uncharacterized protein [Venturia canescens]|uniref:uncharacterized protein n=1 Tax=Venturia canescens TaxID=32260 RepID=UPI001C9CFAC2|nr:uncharacterized protein LOC122414901 [Venturia canescens]